jgi:3-oxoacyl-[acyl-carrier-protein] synthase II
VSEKVRRVVVTGLGAVSCLGHAFDEHWRRLLEGEAGVRLLPTDFPDSFPIKLQAPVIGFEVGHWIRNRMLRKLLLPSATFAVAAVGEALDDAGIADDEALLERCGLYFGSVTYELKARTFEPALRASFGPDGRFDFARFAQAGLELVDPLLIVRGLPNAAPCGVAIEHGLQGPNATFTNGATSGLQAVAVAFDAIRKGLVDIAVVGGSDSQLLTENIVAQNARGQLWAGDETPWLGARPFDRRRRGHVLGEGAAACVMEDADHAAARGARAYGEVLGTGSATDASDEDGAALAAAGRLAISGQEGGSPAVVFGCGTGTIAGDSREASATRRLFGAPALITAATGALGATGAASGVFALLHSLRAFAEELIPGTTGCDEPDPACDVLVVSRATRKRHSRSLVWSSDGTRNVAVLVGAA